MITTLKMRIRDPESRKFFGAYLGGKMVGLGVVMLGMTALAWYFNTKAGAAMLGQEVATKADDIVNPLNTMWVLVAAFLVFFMQAGFMMLEAGFGRTREISNIMLECIADTCLCGLIFWAFGFAFMFGAGNGWIGHQYFFLNNAPATYGSTGVAFLAFFLFQFAFADTCSTITSGAMVGRTAFGGDLVYSFMVSGFIYPIVGHWIWGPDGWLATMDTPFRDFAGSTVVHTVGGMIALAGAIVLGPRLGRKFKRDGGGMPPGHDMILASLGGVILWFGWYGFNPGSTLSAMFFVYPRSHKWDTGISINGFLAGLVAITCPCYWVSPFGAVCIGALAGVIMVFGVDFVEWLRVDDPIGAVAVHGVCGIFGTIAVGLFATGQYGLPGPTGADNSAPVEGLFYGGGTKQLFVQILGSAVVTVSVFAVGMLVMYAVKAMGILRVSEEVELGGIDIHEHGAPAYHPEFAYMGHSAIPSGGGTPAPLPGAPKSAPIRVGD